MDFWERLKDRIKEQKTTQEWVAKEAQVPFGTFRKWLDRKSYPDAQQIVKIAQILKTTAEFLITGSYSEGFSTEEWELVAAYRNLDSRDREEIMGIIRLKLDNVKKGAASSNSGSA
jgi:transcriptional regulator with XRE-family HTH domain